jgi:hypothetical protein
MTRAALPLVLVLACAPERPAATPDDPPDDFDQQSWATTPQSQSGAEGAEGYHGTGRSGDAVERTPAEPRRGGHQPR